ncbi:MAG: NAD(+) synthase [Angelakisella sp.]
MTSVIRVATAVNKVLPADSTACLETLWECVEGLQEQSPDIILFPCLALSGAYCGSFFNSASLVDDCKVVLEQLCILSAEFPCYLVAGLPMEDAGRNASVMAVLNGGAVRGLIPVFDPPSQLALDTFSDMLQPVNSTFRCGNLSFSVLGGNLSALPRRMHLLEKSGCDLVLAPSCEPATAGSLARGCETAKRVSEDYGVAVAVANGGAGEVSSPFFYRGWCGVWECGSRLCFEQSEGGSISALCDIDTDIIRSQKTSRAFGTPLYTTYAAPKEGLLRKIPRHPFEEGRERGDLLEIFELQAGSLAARLENTGIRTLIIGVSGGLDSTLALFVAVRALEQAGLPARNLIAVTMPGFGTTGRTYGNALALIDALGAQRREISIKEACLQHYKDIGLADDDRSAAYENAQARERTQILMDIGNKENALMVGTGDLSEEALGWCTYGGDHLAGYNVNVCLTKGLVRAVCKALADCELFRDTADILRDILDTPVSPELLPAGANGEITQRSEDILGPYELHDFFLYYLIRYNLRPTKIYHYACIAFAGSYRPDYIKDRLVFFLRRFCQSQFKRSCETDSAAILMPNLGKIGYSFPSDLSPSSMIRQLELE